MPPPARPRTVTTELDVSFEAASDDEDQLLSAAAAAAAAAPGADAGGKRGSALPPLPKGAVPGFQKQQPSPSASSRQKRTSGSPKRRTTTETSRLRSNTRTTMMSDYTDSSSTAGMELASHAHPACARVLMPGQSSQQPMQLCCTAVAHVKRGGVVRQQQFFRCRVPACMCLRVKPMHQPQAAQQAPLVSAHGKMLTGTS